MAVTTFGNDSPVHDALRAGAAWFPLKRVDADALAQAVRLVARSACCSHRPYGPSRPRTRAGPRTPGVGESRLTGRESEVLRHRAAGPTDAAMARRLDVGPATVTSHVAAVPARTGTRDRTQAVIAACEAGFLNAR